MIELVEGGVSLREIGPALFDAWEEELDAEASARGMPRTVLLGFIVQEWLQQRRTRDAAIGRTTRRTEREHLRARVLARIADRHDARWGVSVTGLATRYNLTIEATQSIVTELVTAGLLTATLEPTSAGRRHLREYHDIGRHGS